jgi:hypothetical protein
MYYRSGSLSCSFLTVAFKMPKPPKISFLLITHYRYLHLHQEVTKEMFIPDPDFYPFRIPDPGFRTPDPKTATKERGEKKFVVKPFFVSTNFTKLKIILFYKC